ncbi:oxygen-independent coproporphyrinogen III oxidase [Massilia jejuensis]|uniref:Coproporphyrinogen-III oxidase n=1 Tax=Massilia jejuensis TaxID=648894 RepID=A0ABW0PGT0_9BURK
MYPHEALAASGHPSPAALAAGIEFDAGLIERLGKNGPRYTSYPTADRFLDSYGYRDYLHAVASVRTRGAARPLSLYLHIPFCDTVCYYCACNKIVTKQRDKASTYLAYLKREIAMQGALLAGAGEVEQLHFGGGTPTYLSDAQMGELMAHLQRAFTFAPDAAGEYAIEVDPRGVSAERVHSLRRQGFNRISLGVQDFDADVQRVVNRVQPEHETRAIIDAARAAGFRSVSIDLIYGLPKQARASMHATIDKVIEASPDRIALYHYAHLPHAFKPQRRILEADMPSSAEKLDMLASSIEQLCGAGYVYIGMDHFARPGDDLAVAQRQGRLHRNFQGYSTHADSDLVSCGVSAIGAVGATYSQNAKNLKAYYEALDNHELPVVRGLVLGMDDLLRRAVIQALMCQFELSIGAIEQVFPIAFGTYFARELAELRRYAEDGLLTIDDEWLSVTARGRLLIRNLCMVFDRYLAVPDAAPRYSRTV